MYHPKSPLRELLKRIVVYSLMTLAVITVAVTTLFYMLGYRFDQSDNRIEPSGLIQFITTPPGATIEIDGARYSRQSPAKATVSEGSHEFVMWREGYETWRKSLDITTGTLTWLNYTRLIPKERKVEVTAELPNLAAGLASPDRKHYAALAADFSSIQIYDLTRDTMPEPTRLLMQDIDYTDKGSEGVTHTFELTSWDLNGRFMLVKHNYAETFEWLVVDRENSNNTRNLSQIAGLKISHAEFTDTSGRQFVVQEDNNIRYLDLGAETVTRPIVSDVTSFYLDYESKAIAYIEELDEKTGYRSVGVVKRDHQPVTVYTAKEAADKTLQVRAARYFNTDFLMISENKTVTVYSGSYPEQDNDSMEKLTSFEAADVVTQLHVSPNGRFTVAQSGDRFTTYDSERETTSPVSTLAGQGDPRALKWLDDYIVWSDRSGQLVMREFDGANEHAINTVIGGFDATLSQSGKYLYSIGQAENGTMQLQRVRMILN